MKRKKVNLSEELKKLSEIASLLKEAAPAQGVQQPAQQQTQQGAQTQQQGQRVPQTNQQQPQQAGTTQLNPQQVQKNIDTNMDQAMAIIMKQLPNIIKNFSVTSGDKDGQIETGEEANKQPQAQGQQQAKGQPQAQGQVTKENKEYGQLTFDEEKFNSHIKELDESLIAGLMVSTPAIMKMGGWLLQKMGGKANPNVVQKWGQYISKKGEQLHHHYLKSIEGWIAPFTKNMSPEARKKASEAILMGVVAGLFAGHLSHPDALTAIKGQELADYVSKILPKTLSSIGFS